MGYGDAIFANRTVERHIMSKQWQTVMETAAALKLNERSAVLELGCGDGDFANRALAGRFGRVDAFEISQAAVERARRQASSDNVHFRVEDCTAIQYRLGEHWDAAFLVGFLHHVKDFVPQIVASLAQVAPKLVVLEPNGDNWIRKALEHLPAYQSAGEDSFQLKTLLSIFQSHGYTLKVLRKINFVPQFCPASVFPLLKWMESIIEPSPLLNGLCSTYVMGLEKE